MTVQRACLTLIMRRRATVKKRSTERIMSFMCGIAVQRFRARHRQWRSNEELRCVRIVQQGGVGADIRSSRSCHECAFRVFTPLAPAINGINPVSVGLF